MHSNCEVDSLIGVNLKDREQCFIRNLCNLSAKLTAAEAWSVKIHNGRKGSQKVLKMEQLFTSEYNTRLGK